MRRDDSVTVTRTSRVTVTCDNARRSRVSHATTTPPHPTVSSVTAVCGVSGYAYIHRYCRNAIARSGWMDK